MFGACVLAITRVCLAQSPQPELDLVTFEAPPYQVIETQNTNRQSLSGETVNTVNCAANQAGWQTDIRLAPPTRALYSLQRASVDGYFAIDPSAELDAIGHRSHPIALEKWYFFTSDTPSRSDQDRIGVVASSNEEAWLEAQGYEPYLKVTSPSQLPALLERGRIDRALMDKRAMNNLNAKNSARMDGLHSRFLRYAPLHLYVSDRFTTVYPEFLPAFNRALPDCMHKTLALSSLETQHIRSLAEKLFNELTGVLDVQEALNAGPRHESLAEVLSIDSKWEALGPQSRLPLASHILSLPASQALSDWQDSHQGLVTEVMLISDLGATAAMSQLTSGYWQGDELNPHMEEARKVLAGQPEDSVAKSSEQSPSQASLHITPIEYDTSTARFQVTVSTPVFSKDRNGAPIGAIALGLDIEKAMWR